MVAIKYDVSKTFTLDNSKLLLHTLLWKHTIYLIQKIKNYLTHVLL